MPEQKQDMTLGKLLQIFKSAAEDIGFNYSESIGDKRELSNATMEYLCPLYAIIHKPGLLGGKRIAVYEDYDDYGNRKKWIGWQCQHGINLYAPHGDIEIVRPTFSSILNIDDEDVRKFIAKFYDFL